MHRVWAFLTLALVAGCATSAGPGTASTSRPQTPSAEPSASGLTFLGEADYVGPTCDGGPRISRDDEPDYPDWVMVDGRRYFLHEKAEPDTRLGPVILRVRCTLGYSGTRPSYTPRSGDSTFLGVGTAVYSVQGASRATLVATDTRDGVELWGPE